MPLFLQHIQNTVKQSLAKIILSNKDETRYEKVLEKVENQDPLESMFAEDIFSLFNQQIAILGPKLQGDAFVSVVRTWLQNIQNTIEDKTEEFVGKTSVDRILMFPLEINDYNKLLLNLNDCKSETQQFSSEDQTDKLTQLFIETAKTINKCQDSLIQSMTEVMFIKIEDLAIEPLFT